MENVNCYAQLILEHNPEHNTMQLLVDQSFYSKQRAIGKNPDTTR